MSFLDKLKRKRLIKKLRSWGDGPHWKYVMDLLEPHISEQFYKPKGDPVLTVEDYENIQRAELQVHNARMDIILLYQRCPEDFDRERYAQLGRFLGEAENRMRGARQMCEQLLFDGDPTYSGRPQ